MDFDIVFAILRRGLLDGASRLRCVGFDEATRLSYCVQDLGYSFGIGYLFCLYPSDIRGLGVWMDIHGWVAALDFTDRT